MCGITGLYNYSDLQVDSKSIIKKIINIQHNRGPDDNGMWESQCKKIFFGHNRLSVIDLSPNGKQPFISSDDNFVITFNGEIYNFLELKNELLKKNITFKSNSDTEVLIESYKYWGLDFLKKLRGMFAFAIWDSAQKKIILARDPFRIKPLYYTIQKDVFYFASEIGHYLLGKHYYFPKSSQYPRVFPLLHKFELIDFFRTKSLSRLNLEDWTYKIHQASLHLIKKYQRKS